MQPTGVAGLLEMLYEITNNHPHVSELMTNTLEGILWETVQHLTIMHDKLISMHSERDCESYNIQGANDILESYLIDEY